MPWKETNAMSEKKEFLHQAKQEGAKISALCREFGISRKTGYKWLKREREEGQAGLGEHTRRPHHSPAATPDGMVGKILSVRSEHETWGGRKIRKVLCDRGERGVPAASTITSILDRNGLICPEDSLTHKPICHFEREQPNQLWQMDFKGPFPLLLGGDCHPLTVIDDHSRFLVGLRACPNQTFLTVQAALTHIFRLFGLPERILVDNGAPWGDDRQTRHTILTAWLLRLEVEVSHGRPYHPQTQGKCERLNRTLKEELISRHSFSTLQESQARFDRWQQEYNCQRPHQALGLKTPSTLYQPSPRPFPEVLPPVFYEDRLVRKVDATGKISFANRIFHIGKAFRGQMVALRPLEVDGGYQVIFYKNEVAQIDLRGDNLQC